MQNIVLSLKTNILYKRGTNMGKIIKDAIDDIKKWVEIHTFWSSVIASIVASLILGVLGYFFAIKPIQNLGNEFNTLSNNIDNSLSITTETNNKLEGLQEQITEVKNDVELQSKNYNDQIVNLQTDLTTKINNVENTFNNYKTEVDNQLSSIINSNDTIVVNNEIMVNPAFAKSVQNTYRTDTAVFNNSNQKQFNNAEEILFINLKTNDMYTFNDLNEHSIPMHYIDDNGDDVFFKGQYDENGYWNGNCIVNRYNNGNLVLIMDAEYNSGKLIQYKQVFSYQKTFGGKLYDVWAIAEREPENSADKGFTWTYLKNQEYQQHFETNSFDVSNIMNVENFKNSVKLLPEGYYNGYISDGYYNDTTGKAYLVKYNEYGNVRYLYVGKIENGYPNDNSGNAWCISWGYDNKNYYYYKGNFTNGEHANTPQKISSDEIDNIIKGYTFECPLNWIKNT